MELSTARFEEAIAELVRFLRENEQAAAADRVDAAARLSTAAPTRFALINDQLVRALKAADGELRRARLGLPARLTELVCLPHRILGRGGVVQIGWAGDLSEPNVVSYVGSWRRETSKPPCFENLPWDAEFSDSMKWARERTDTVVVRPHWDPQHLYLATDGEPADWPPAIKGNPRWLE